MSAKKLGYIWQYTIRPELRAEFLAAYRPGGAWAELFSRDPGYIETELLCDENDDNRSLTVDYWVSKSARDSFRKSYAADFEHLDAKCERYTHQEEFIGDFEVFRHPAA